MAQTAASLECESLKIKQPRAVKEGDVQLTLEKSQPAVSLSNVGGTLVSAFPFAVAFYYFPILASFRFDSVSFFMLNFKPNTEET